ncbi:MAG: hypothetical protein ACO1N9_07335 [Flavobacterium sp.]
MNKRFDQNLMQGLSAAIDKLEAKLDCEKFREYSNVIDIDSWENIQGQMQHNKSVADEGFGFCISNFFENGDWKRIIVINMENCNRLDLTQDEIVAVILHELGHLLNSPEFAPEPNLMDCLRNGSAFDINERDTIRTANATLNEVYADSYANVHGYGAELLSTFKKYHDYFNKPVGYFEERAAKINSDELLEGTVKPIEIMQ